VRRRALGNQEGGTKVTARESRMMALPLLLATAIGASDLLTRGYPLVGLLAIPPLIAAVRCGPRATAVVSAYSLAISVGLGFSASVGFGSADHVTRVAVVVAASIFAVLLAGSRVRRQRAERSRDEVMAMLDGVLENAPLGMAMVDRDQRFLIANDALARLTGVAVPDHIGRRPAELGRELAMLESPMRQVFETGEAVLGQELTTHQTDQSSEWLINYYPVKTRYQRIVGVGLTISDITDRKRFEQQLAHSDRRFRSLIESNTIGVIEANHDHILQANDVFLDMVGYRREQLEAGELSWRDMTPPEYADDDARAVEELERTGRCTPYEKEYVCSDGSRVPVLIGATEVGTAPTRWLCFALDLTERREAEAAMRESESRLRMALEGTSTGTWDWHVGSADVAFSETTGVLYGLGMRAPTAEEIAERVHPDDRSVGREARKAVAEGSDFALEYRVVWPNGSVHWLEARGHPVMDSLERPTRYVGLIRDITDRKRQEDALAYLAQANATLDTSLDLDETLIELARITIPTLGDGCIVNVVVDANTILRVGYTGDDKRPVVRKRRSRTDLQFVGDHPVAVAMRTGEVQVLEEIGEEARRRWWSEDERLGANTEMSWPGRSVVIAPMRVGETMLGTLSIASLSEDRVFDRFDVLLIAEIARRAAVAVDNARMFTERTYVAETLQQSLLPSKLPVFDGMELAACYRAGGAGVDVGGDFYDAFETAKGWGLMIGDVSGKGAIAASATALARYTTRAVALWESQPSKMMATVNAGLRNQFGSGQFCTMVCAVIDDTENGCTLTMCLGGHPQPMLLRRDGSVDQVGIPGSLLGAIDDPHLSDARVSVGPGETLVFFTDGVTETRTGSGRIGERGLADMLRGWEGGRAVTLVRHIEDQIARLRVGAERDDIAVLVLKVDEQPVSDGSNRGVDVQPGIALDQSVAGRHI